MDHGSDAGPDPSIAVSTAGIPSHPSPTELSARQPAPQPLNEQRPAEGLDVLESFLGGARLLAPCAMATRVEDRDRRGDQTEDEAAGGPLHPYSDRVDEEDDDDGRSDQHDDRGMRAEALHRRNWWMGSRCTPSSLWRLRSSPWDQPVGDAAS